MHPSRIAYAAIVLFLCKEKLRRITSPAQIDPQTGPQRLLDVDLSRIVRKDFLFGIMISIT